MSVQTLGDQQPFLIDLPSNQDERGVLTSVEATHNIPIEILRIFYMHHMTQDRGVHSHIDTDQVVVLVHGAAALKLTCCDGGTSNYLLNDPCVGLYIPRLTFVEICEPSEGAVCLVLANTFYDMSKSLRNMQEYKDYIAENQNSIAKGGNPNG